AVTQHRSFSVRVGDEVTLPCKGVKDYQDKCHSTTWSFSDLTTEPADTLFEGGQIHREAASKSDRLSVTEKCSLVIKKVTDEDVGRYACRQFDESGKQVTGSDVDLIVTY
uniref:Ig-like domain-containing protein n=1 Tax=Acanthochromis polyacanthus TaxID=80966 RepID=A0A3Q1EHM3_9TELE